MGLTSAMGMAYAIAVLSAMAAVILLFAASHDIAFRTVPNWIPAALLLIGSLLRIIGGTLTLGLMACILVTLGAAFCWWRGWLGGGDVKLLAATAVLVPPALAVNLLLDVALAGGVLAILYLALGRLVAPPSHAPHPPGLLRRICRAEHYRIHRRGPLPYASAIAAGALLVLFKG
jgi:prepilin peptidase CpaA